MSATAATAAPASPSLLDRLPAFIVRHERLCLILTLAIFALSAGWNAAIRPLWFDEFFTAFISRLSAFHEMVRAMPADGQPPLQYVLTRYSLHWFGFSEFTVRLPEVLAYLAAGVLTWRIVRVHCGAIPSLFAVTMLMGATVSEFSLGGIAVAKLAITARPYELLLAFTVLAFACWQAAALRSTRRLLPLCGLSLAVAGAILSHHMGTLQVGLFLATGEVVRILRRRRFDLPMLAAILVGLLSLVITLPIARQTRVILGDPVLHSTNFWGRPSLMNLAAWPLMVPSLILVPVVLLACFRRSASSAPTRELPAVPAHEIAAAVALVLLFPAQIVMAWLATGYSQPRYAIGATLGLVLLCVWIVPRLGSLRTLAPVAQSWIAGGYIAVIATTVLVQISHPAGRTERAQLAVSPLLFRATGDLPIVAASAFDYLPLWWYAPPEIRPRLIYLSDPAYAVRQPALLAELSLVADHPYTPVPLADYSSFVGSHSQFLLRATGRPQYNWTVSRLASSGWRLTLLAQEGGDQLYRADRP